MLKSNHKKLIKLRNFLGHKNSLFKSFHPQLMTSFRVCVCHFTANLSCCSFRGCSRQIISQSAHATFHVELLTIHASFVDGVFNNICILGRCSLSLSCVNCINMTLHCYFDRLLCPGKIPTPLRPFLLLLPYITHPITLLHFTSHHITSHHITSHHITSLHRLLKTITHFSSKHLQFCSTANYSTNFEHAK